MTKKISFKGFPYKNHVIVAFEKDQILQMFGTDKIEFEASIVNDKLVLMSQTIRTAHQ